MSAELEQYESENEVDPRSKPRYIRGHRKIDLMHELANGVKTQGQLAKEYGVTQQTIYSFNRRYKEDILAVREKRDNEMTGLWVADKQRRIAEYETDITVLNEAMDGLPITDFMMRKHAALRAVAEELGQIPNKAQGIEAKVTVNHQINGVDVDNLK